MARPFLRGRSPSRALTRAAASFTRTTASTSARGSRSPEMGKFSTARAVWAPHSALAGTFTSPMVSCSTRVRTPRVVGFRVLRVAAMRSSSLVASAPEPVPEPAEGQLRLGVLDLARRAGGDGLVEHAPAEDRPLLQGRAVPLRGRVERPAGLAARDLGLEQVDLLRDDPGEHVERRPQRRQPGRVDRHPGLLPCLLGAPAAQGGKPLLP